MFDTSRLTIVEQEVLAAALDAHIAFLEVQVQLVPADYRDNSAWRLWQARELRDALR